jgi:hypothetical protein
VKVEFLTTLDLRFHDGVRWQLTAPFVATVDDLIVRVPDGFLTDFASVPRLPLIYLQFANKAHLPAVLHDWLYSQGGDEQDRKYADDVFLHGMFASGMSEQDAYSMFDAVRAFGKQHFGVKYDA